MQPTITPYLAVKDAAAAIDFYVRAFGTVEVGPRLTSPDGKIMHTELQIGSSVMMLAEEFPEFDNLSPETIGGTPVRIAMQVDDADAIADRAVEAGAELLIPVADQFYGERSGRLADPFGHIWILSQKIEDVSAEEIQRRAEELFGGQ